MPDPSEIAAIVLAAGGSSRFGSDKLLYPLTLQGVTLPLAAHSLLPWLESFEKITVVVRPGSEAFCREIEIALGAKPASAIRWIVCEDASQGMSASLVCGLRANCGSDGCLIGLADMPVVPATAIGGVRNALLRGAGLAAPFHEDRRGHPVGFASFCYDELLSLKGDVGARGLLEQNRSKVIRVEIHSKGIFADVDSQNDLQNL